jgi:S1-C subfamily serine protease
MYKFFTFLIIFFLLSCSDGGSPSEHKNIKIGNLNPKVTSLLIESNKGNNKAISELSEMAKDGDLEANKALALMHLQGQVVKKDVKKAIAEFKVAADGGDQYAAKILYQIYSSKKYKDTHQQEAEKYSEMAGVNTNNLTKNDTKNYLEKLKKSVADNKWNEYKIKQNDEITRSGSAAAINGDGYFVTNKHVVNGCSTILVGYNQMLAKASSVILFDKADIGLIKVQEKTPAFLTLPKAKANLGERIFVGGYPLINILGFDLKMTDGIVSGNDSDRNETLIQISASISSGNSGGPVVDERMMLVGIATSGRVPGSRDGVLHGHGINFATHSEEIKLFAKENNISYTISSNLAKRESQEIAEFLKLTTGLVICVRSGK